MADAGHMSGGKPVVPAPPVEQRYTLEEAQAHLAARYCGAEGHDFEHITNAAGEVLQMFCAHCYKRWEVTEA